MRKAVYPGTFDPITNGHLDIIERCFKLFDQLIVVVATNRDKKPLFTLEERLDFIRQATRRYPNIEVQSADELIVDFAKKVGAIALVRGLRFISDFDFEFQMAWMNRQLNEEITTVFLMPNEKYSYVNSSLLREVASLGGNIEELVPSYVAQKLKQKFHIPS